MSHILPHYETSEQTMALIPVNHTDYKTIAIKIDRTLHIKKTPFEIILRGCLDNFSSFVGRRESVTHLTGFKRKAPIPISVYRNIFVFPTHLLRFGDVVGYFIIMLKVLWRRNRTTYNP